ncbi:penicillin-binding protein 1C [Aquimarina brevivitae]|uniref:peptidoglycan glycosyltransferase n=1 Tax=Aquimarina brevivitae TaxID=323412 RepID=A0A4Q7PF56_9FLAO|nr:penicillin-binding protein 1C [Aquimarina brevivitae]RZS99084.1 penicillin-binding protein 1C [Aquimarina brevivitae]
MHLVKKIINYLNQKKLPLLITTGVLIWYYFSLPNILFDEPTATVLDSAEGHLLGAQIAEDGQWRFPKSDSVPHKFKACILAFEDQQFYRHPGFNPVTISKALVDNLEAGKVVRGGSTITQQVIRLSRKNQERTYVEKLKELILATRLELRYSKEEILALYASYAPFGGNVVGLDMASWRYFSLPPYQLSWAESATLAVLPNAPALIYPGKNKELLRQKRNRLLHLLFQQGTIDKLTYTLALEEDLPAKPYDLPQIAPHALQYINKSHRGKRVQTSIKYRLQQQVNVLVNQHYALQKQNEVHNLAVLVLDVKQRKVISYVGNAPTDNAHQKDVDVIQAARSTGSTLKPLLYAAMMDKGELLPQELVADVPTVIAGYNPQNFDESYSGAVPANRALARSLNIPAVRLLQQYGLERFRDELRAFKIKDLKFSASHYGLSLIVGGAEGSLWDLCKTYAGLAGTLTHFNETSSEYYQNEFIEPSLLANEEVKFGDLKREKMVYGAGSIWLTFQAMKEVNRPQEDEAWKFYDSARQIAWKTGTSFGNRDAWAIGIDKNYVVGVWLGNADGEGRPELTGLNAAAPLLFDVFNLLPKSEWFATPYDDLMTRELCQKSGAIAGNYCPVTSQLVVRSKYDKMPCVNHKLVHLTRDGQYRVNSSCESVSNMIQKSWFVLPPLEAYFYKNSQADYQPLPPFKSNCMQGNENRMDFIFPKNNSIVYLPKDFDGQKSEVVLKIAHTNPTLHVYWYVDENYLGVTKEYHELAIQPAPGMHIITALDDYGNEIKTKLEVRE